jgi:hypothetical protein
MSEAGRTVTPPLDPKLDSNWIVHLEIPLHMVAKVLAHLRRGMHLEVHRTWLEISTQVQPQLDAYVKARQEAQESANSAPDSVSPNQPISTQEADKSSPSPKALH